MPDKFFRRVVKDLPPLRQYAVGNVFFAPGTNFIGDAKRIFEEYARIIVGLRCVGWRVVPTCNEGLGATAKNAEPHIEQAIVVAEGECAENEDLFMATLYRLRRTASWAINKRLQKGFYFCSLSCRTITYKGMLTCGQLSEYFPDLREPDFEAHVAIVHSRFSTNTFPSWQRAHPYRLLAHNGEINTIKGNTNWMKAREALISSPMLPNIEDTFPLFHDDQTDSSQFDNIMEVIALGGRPLAEVAMLMVPQAWEKTPFITDKMKDFYKVQAAVMEPWDGPALLCYTDSNTAGACLDRNGLRPCRYYITKDNRIICASEAGVIPAVEPADVVKKGRLQPGHIISIDFKEHKVLYNDEVKEKIAASRPFGKWIREEGITLADLRKHAVRPAKKFSFSQAHDLRMANALGGGGGDDGPRPGDPSDQGLRAFGYTTESLELLLLPMADKGQEALGSMGNDTPLACLSDLPRPVYDFFYQRFAQVSNPPVDPIRESSVMSLSAWVGPETNLLAPLSAKHCRRLWLESPCLLPAEMDTIYAMGGFRGWRIHSIDATFPVCEGTRGLERHLIRVCHEACDAIRFGSCKILVLTDRAVARDRAPLPALLCSGAVHQALVREKLRLHAGLVVDSGEPHEVAHHCLLATFGADAVCPYNAYEAISKLVRDGNLSSSTPETELYKNYQKAVGAGMLKVMAKMGISCIQSYKGAQIAEPIGLHEDVTRMCFTGSDSQVGGLVFSDIAERSLRLHSRGFPVTTNPCDMITTGLYNDGKYHLRQLGDSELHLNEPMAIAKLQEAARTNSRAAYAQFAAIHNKTKTKGSLCGQLEFRSPEEYSRKALSIDEVESAANIVKRFRTGAMSYGSISMEAHATLAMAMNKLGGKSNTGEGGEDPLRFREMADGHSANSAIKQVASGRFGVTIEYLTNAKEIQIKMAQGAKPGEGGELPGWKVEPHIAECRNSTPGVGLVSPPPHHDIYSIEDLAQLIYDLKSANPEASVSVKLVSEQGVGVVAAGVAKCKADHILISGCEGGTGASKWTGIKHAGAPWELGLAESHQTLVLNGLRGRVSLETDGQLRTGRDVIIAALLGAEHFGFATAPLIAMGCIMMRKCHLNTCPVGIATQDPVLRAKFEGLPEHVVNYLFMIAEEARTLMARLGFRSVDELVGHTEVLTVNPTRFFETPLVLTKLLTPAHLLPDAGSIGKVENRKMYEQDHSDILPPGCVTAKLIEAFQGTLETGRPSKHTITGVRNLERSVGTVLASRWGDSLAAGACHAKLEGTSGQSFGAFCGKGIFLELEGDGQAASTGNKSSYHICVAAEPVARPTGSGVRVVRPMTVAGVRRVSYKPSASQPAEFRSETYEDGGFNSDGTFATAERECMERHVERSATKFPRAVGNDETFTMYCMGGGGKPVIEHTEVQQFKSLQGGETKLREWSGTLLNAFAQDTTAPLHQSAQGDPADPSGPKPGAANFAKGLSGGVVVVYPNKKAMESGFKSEENVIVGNVCLYGATKGAAFVRGICAERFAVRNSGAWAVVEGVGDHCCEYMTGGRVAVLGITGSNFAAGMSGGVAWVWDPKFQFERNVNKEMVKLSRMAASERHEAYPHDSEDLQDLLRAHSKLTGSAVAGDILARWPQSLPEFVRVFPTDYEGAMLKGDKGKADSERFRSWLPQVDVPMEAPKVQENGKAAKDTFKFPTLDIEDCATLSKRPKVDAEEALKGNNGFVKFSRAEIAKRDIKARAGDFVEIYTHEDKQAVRTQAARCMDCGTPFCHQSVTQRSGCPLGNLIPEWNALVKKGDWKTAFMRLRQTNNFPEFTGRVCPAPCEAACTLGIIDDPARGGGPGSPPQFKGYDA
ncbi:unnamed protein product [Prorocentrum cordatum]|uniref:Glutamine amidotransferase type-2 domain-containing protein n=1 Tax=Prorocentrum cordatum TaxID=2364126 RepID=A0ABN9VU63_9DINO|nr:unnamed protein product [Polarella glacialis]